MIRPIYFFLNYNLKPFLIFQVMGVSLPSGVEGGVMIEGNEGDTSTLTERGNVITSHSLGGDHPVQYATIEGDVIGIFPDKLSMDQISDKSKTYMLMDSGNNGDDVTATSFKSATTESNKQHPCTVCGKIFPLKSALQCHMDQVHKELHVCPKCLAAFTTKTFLHKHMALHNKPALPTNTFETLASTATNSSLIASTSTNTANTSNNRKLYLCEVCKAVTFSSKQALNRHCAKVHKVPGRSYKNSGTNPAEKPYGCDLCESRFQQQSDLKRHRLGHTGEKPFRCTGCNTGFTRMSSLNKHMRIHTGEKPYQCEECNVAFAYKYQFNRHAAKHKSNTDGSNTTEMNKAVTKARPTDPPDVNKAIANAENFVIVEEFQ